MSEHPHIGRFFSAEDEDCLSLEDMQAYAAGQLSPERRHAVERHLLNCELCSLAYEGLVEEDPAEVEAAVEFLTTEAWNRVEAREKRKRRGVYWWMSGAAVAIILIVVGYFSLDQQNSQDLNRLAAEMLEEGGEFAEAEPPASRDRGEKTAEEELPPPPPASNEPLEFDGSFHGNAQHSLPTNSEKTLADGELDDAANKDLEIIERPDADLDQLDFEALDPVAEESRPVILNQDGKTDSKANRESGWFAEGKKDLSKEVEKDGVKGFVYASPDLNSSSTGYTTTLPAGNAVTGVTANSPVTTGSIAPNAPLFSYDSTMVDKEALDRSLNRRDSLSLDNLALADDAEFLAGEEFDEFGAGNFQIERVEEEEVFEMEDAMVEPLQEKNEVTTKLQDTRTIAGDEVLITGGISNDNISSTRKKERNRPGKAKRSADVGNAIEQQDIPIPDAYRQGVEQFRRQEFSNAASSLRQAVSETPDNLEAHLLAARSFLEINQPSAALFHLNRILSQQDTGLHQDANWYKSIAHLQMGEKEKARAVLEKIKAEGGKWKRPASEALNKF